MAIKKRKLLLDHRGGCYSVSYATCSESHAWWLIGHYDSQIQVVVSNHVKELIGDYQFIRVGLVEF